MKVFISWSGERSKQVAELFKIWLKCVIQACDPWVSTQDIDSGSVWFTEIGNQLSETSIGIICLTRQNKDKPWILFEAGALTKGLTTSRVIPFLVDLAPQDLQPPLSQLNAVSPERAGVYALVRTMNLQLKEGQLTAEVFNAVFDTYWPQFENSFSAILNATDDGEKVENRKDKDILSEILLTVRNFDRRILTIENITKQPAPKRINNMSFGVEGNAWENLRKLMYRHIESFILHSKRNPTYDEIEETLFKTEGFASISDNARRMIFNEVMSNLSFYGNLDKL